MSDDTEAPRPMRRPKVLTLHQTISANTRLLDRLRTGLETGGVIVGPSDPDHVEPGETPDVAVDAVA